MPSPLLGQVQQPQLGLVTVSGVGKKPHQWVKHPRGGCSIEGEVRCVESGMNEWAWLCWECSLEHFPGFTFGEQTAVLTFSFGSRQRVLAHHCCQFKPVCRFFFLQIALVLAEIKKLLWVNAITVLPGVLDIPADDVPRG